MLRGGVIGFGAVGQSLTKQINNGNLAKITAVCDIDPSKIELARSSFDASAGSDLETFLKQDIDFVIVASQNSAHKEHVVAAANAGKHVFCEKPIALNLADADAMIEACSRTKVVNHVNYVLRYTDAYIKMKELVDSGKIGNILTVWRNLTRGYPLYASGYRHFAVCNPARSGGWAVHCACHGIDVMCWLAGPVATVYSQMQSSVAEFDSEEVVMGLFRLKNGAVGMVGDMMCAIANLQAGIIGTKGQVVLDDSGKAGQGVLRLKFDGKDEQEIPLGPFDADLVSLRTFFDCINNGTQSPSPLSQARYSLGIALAMQQSNRSGKVIELNGSLQ